MVREMNTDSKADGAISIGLELYVAGRNAHSARAITNLRALCSAINCTVEVRIIDVMESPQAALERRVFATPSLVITCGARSQLLVGDLSDGQAFCDIITSMMKDLD